MQIICVQHDIVWENKAATHAKVRAMLERAKPAKGALVVLAEMFATGFSLNVAGISETRNPETHDFLAETAAKFEIYLLGGLVTTGNEGRGRNEAVLFSPQGHESSRYQKMHPFSPGGEADSYRAGNAPVSFSWGGFTVCPFICYDLRFPEIFRSATRAGANLFAVIASWPAARAHHWVNLLQARAIENQAYVVGVNRSGKDPKFTYPGRSMIVDFGGHVLADAGNGQGVIRADVDFEALKKYREELPFLKDMREDYVTAVKR